MLACCGSTLVAVDQHAADERVQLEDLQRQLDQEVQRGPQQQQQQQEEQEASVPVLQRQLLSGSQQVSFICMFAW